MYYNDN
jgi:protein lifeguard